MYFLLPFIQQRDETLITSERDFSCCIQFSDYREEINLIHKVLFVLKLFWLFCSIWSLRLWLNLKWIILWTNKNIFSRKITFEIVPLLRNSNQHWVSFPAFFPFQSKFTFSRCIKTKCHLGKSTRRRKSKATSGKMNFKCDKKISCGKSGKAEKLSNNIISIRSDRWMTDCGWNEELNIV